MTAAGALPDDDTGAPTPRKVAVGLVMGATEYRRDNPLVEAVRLFGTEWTAEELTEKWHAWSAL